MTRILSWNIRAGGGKRAAAIMAQILEWQPDIIGLSEFRGTPASQWIGGELESAGFQHQLSSINAKFPARNALLLASRHPLVPIDLPGMPRIRERWISARVEGLPNFIIGLMHIPNYTEPKRKYPFMNAVLRLAKGWNGIPGLFIGDTNCGKREIDEEKPSPSIFKREHVWIEKLERQGWADAFRHLEGDRREYTWYSHRNNGFRLDQAYCSPQLIAAITRMRHGWGKDPAQPQRRDALSDHAAILLDIDLGQLKQAAAP